MPTRPSWLARLRAWLRDRRLRAKHPRPRFTGANLQRARRAIASLEPERRAAERE